MALSKDAMAAAWAKRKAHVDEMFQNGASLKAIFDELCFSTYSGDEFYNVPGIVNNDVNSLIDIFCHIIVADYAINCIIDTQTINVPDHSEILTAICTQLKQDNVDIYKVYAALDKADTANWFVTNSNELEMVHLNIKEMWDKC